MAGPGRPHPPLASHRPSPPCPTRRLLAWLLPPAAGAHLGLGSSRTPAQPPAPRGTLATHHRLLFILPQLPRPLSSLPLCFHGFMALMTAIFQHLQPWCDNCTTTMVPPAFPYSSCHSGQLGAQKVPPGPHQEGSALSLVHHPVCGRVKKGLLCSWMQPWLFLLPLVSVTNGGGVSIGAPSKG